MSVAKPDEDGVGGSESSAWRACGIVGSLLSLLLSICLCIRGRPGCASPFSFK